MVLRFSRRLIWIIAVMMVLVAGAAVAVPATRSIQSQALQSQCRESVNHQPITALATVWQRWLAGVADTAARLLGGWEAIPTADIGSETIVINDPSQVHIFIDRYTQSLTVFEGEREVISYPVAVGKEETPTPPGEWRINHKDKHWGDGFGTRWMGINVPWGIYGIHGTNKPWSIGTAASAGCIRMFNENVEELYEVVPLGTPVVISGDLPSVSARPSIGPGNSGKYVLVMQFRFRQAGFDIGPIDGQFGPSVVSGVQNFQSLFGFPVDGVVSRDQQRILWYPR